MSNPRGKDAADEEYYSSQPVSKTSKWVFPKWRRTSKNTGETSKISENAPELPTENANENPPEDPPENQQQKRKWVFAKEEAENWSQDAVEFYNNGDAPFCYSRLFDHMKLDSDFWGTLLGYRCNGRLWPMVNNICFTGNYVLININYIYFTTAFVICYIT